MSNTFLFSLPAVTEWIIIIIALIFFAIFPVLTIVFYLQARGLKKKNKELLGELLNRSGSNSPKQ